VLTCPGPVANEKAQSRGVVTEITISATPGWIAAAPKAT
jgi:hypothetical protein